MTARKKAQPAGGLAHERAERSATTSGSLAVSACRVVRALLDLRAPSPAAWLAYAATIVQPIAHGAKVTVSVTTAGEHAEARDATAAHAPRATARFAALVRGGGRLLTIEARGPDQAWSLDPERTEPLAELANVAADAYARRFIDLALHRARLLASLSDAQRALAPMLATTIPDRAIARQIGRSAHTVHQHARAVCLAWGVRDRDELRDLWRGLRPDGESLLRATAERAE